MKSQSYCRLPDLCLFIIFSATVGSALAQSNSVYREVYTGISGSVVGDLTNNAKFPNSPDQTGYLTSYFEAPTDVGDYYGQRCRALLTAPTTGNYTFWIASDDASTLFLSTNESPANKAPIAYVSGWTSSREWTREANQQSAPISLVAGQRYYIEALQKEGGGGDNLAVRWRLPNATIEEPIPVSRLVAKWAPVITAQPSSVTNQEGTPVTFAVQFSNFEPPAFQWQRNSNNIPGATGPSYTLTSPALTNNGDRYRCVLSNALGQATSSNAVLTLTADTTRPTLVSAANVGNNHVRVVFSEAVLSSTALAKTNYVITNLSGTLPVTQASAGPDAKTVDLTTVSQDPGAAYTITVDRVRDASSNTNQILANSQIKFTNQVFTAGYVLRQLYYDIGSGNAVSDLTGSAKFPNSPDAVDYPSSMGWPSENIADAYGGRLSGFLVPPVSGSYTFAIRSDDNSQVFLSTNDQPANKVLLTAEGGCCNSFDVNVSAPVMLAAGQRYYIEALMKEGGGGDYLYVAWKTPLDPANWIVVPGACLGNFFGIPLANSSVTITQPPTNTTVVAGQNATFSVQAFGTSDITTNVSYQWQVNGVDIDGATSAIFTTPAVYETNSGAAYRVWVSVPGQTVISATALLTVVPDTFPPTLVRVQNVGTTNLSVVFSEPVDPATATNRLNYTFTNGVTVASAAFGVDAQTILLRVSPLSIGSTNTLFISNVRDQATNHNTIAPASFYTFIATEYAPQDIGSSTPTGSYAAVPGGYNVTGGGSGIGGGSDQFQFSYQPRTGDFDLEVRLQLLSLADVWAKAGLMAREDLTASSRFAAALATPTLAGCFFQYRDPAFAASSTLGTFPPNYPYTWLRLRRVGNVFTGYASYDGQTWTQLGTATIAMPSTIWFGLCVSSRDGGQLATAQFRDLATVSGDTIGTLPVNFEPLGPSSRKTGLVISEIMYKPAPRADTNNLEFIELFNSNPFAEDLSGYRISGDVDFTFPPGAVMPGGSFLVLAAQPVELQSIYGLMGATVLGPYAHRLSASGTVRLRTDQDAVLLEVNYDSEPPWPVAADGAGHSLVLARPSYGEADPKAWDISDAVGGSPGTHDGVRFKPQRAVVINEFLAHTDAPSWDFIELYNHSTVAVDLSGCVLTDNPDTNKFVMPPGTTIPARGFLAFYETNMNFSLSAAGESLFFKSADLTRVLDAVKFEAQANGVSMGRWPNGAADFYPLAARTPGGSNSAVLVREIVINEIMYDPISRLDDDQYVEVYNRGTNPVNLGAWQFTSGINYTFPSNTVLATNGYVVVARNPARLLANYTNLTSANTFGPFTGTLAGRGERLALSMPDTIVSTNSSGVVKTNTIYIVVDELTYGTGGKWPKWANSGGSSMELIDPRSNHRLPSNWADSDETAKAPWTYLEASGPMDLGSGTANAVEGGLLEEGECLLDNVEVIQGTSGPNLVGTPDFETGLGSWILRGSHVRSSLETSGGFGGGQCLHVRATSRCDYGPNRLYLPLTATPSGTVTMRAKVRWLKGWPEFLLRLHGNYFEVTGRLSLPTNLGTPGARNSRAANNAPPALYEVAHSPVLPAASQPVTVTARVHDPDGVSSLVLQYRVDPSTTYTSVTMTDNGSGADTVAQDGLYSAAIPGQAAGTLVAFIIRATDAPGASSMFPTNTPANGRMRECLVRFGEPVSASSFGTYRMWFTEATVNDWINRPIMSNEPEEGTFVYGNWRVVHNFGCRYAGSPWHQGWGSPLSDCHYTAGMPADELVLGTDNFNKIHSPGNGPFDDDTLQREQAGNWIARQIHIPWTYRRFVNVYVNGNQRRPNAMMEDMQVPGPEFIKEYFPDDADGSLHKNQGWYEMDDAATGAMPNTSLAAWCTLDRFTTTVNGVPNQHKLTRYRWNWFVRAAKGTANDYTNVFNLVDAANTADNGAYTTNILAMVNMEEWLRTWAVRHSLGDWDAFGTQNAQNSYAYKPDRDRWHVFLFDMNIIMGNGSWGPGANLLSGSDGIMNSRIYGFAPFRRMYLRALKDIASGPMDSANFGPMVDAKYAAIAASGIYPNTPSGIKSWIAQARSSILSQVASEDAPAFVVNGTNYLASTTNLITLTGVAPVEIKTIEINGASWTPVWTTPTQWTLQIPVSAGTNQLAIVGYDYYGQAVAGASNNLTVVYTGPAPSPVGSVVISEIMYNPLVPGASYVEIYNLSTNFSFDLSGWPLNGIDFTFSDGAIIPPGGFLVVAKDRDAFINTYGFGVPLAGQFNGTLSNEGETLTLIKPGPTPDQDLVVDEVRYDQNLPWPVAANGTGASLQLIDATQDNRRVCNWGTITNTSTVPQWTYVTVTGQALAASPPLYIYLNSAGDVYLDDIKLVAGSVPEAGANLIQNGDFETALTGPWTVSTNLSGSAISSSVKHLGNGALHLVSSSGGSTRGSSIWQDTPLTNGTTYTLSYWYLPSTNGDLLTLRLSGYGIASTHSIAPPSTVLAIASPGTTNSIHATLPAFPPLWINEVMPINTSTLADRFGHHEPWLEVYNAGTNTINLNGFYLSDNYTNLANWPFPANAAIGPREFKLIFADAAAGESLTNELHTSFHLNATTGAVALVQVIASQPRVLDYVNYRLISDGRSYGSLPDGQPIHRQVFGIPTPGGTNNGTFLPVQVFINEWMAANTGTLTDPADGKYDDWFELYNAGPTTVDLSSYTLTDDLSTPGQYVIPAGKTIPPGGFLLVWADGDTTQNTFGPEIHANFSLSKSGESIGLFDPNGNLIDAAVFLVQVSDVSEGRGPDGTANILAMTTPTPGTPNVYTTDNTPPVLQAINNKSVNEGELLTFTAVASDSDLPAQTLTFGLDPGAPSGAAVHPVTGVFTWIPTEVQGPNAYTITLRVTDNGTPNLSATRTFQVTVAEVNSAPTLATVPEKTVNEGNLLTFTNVATDTDTPANTLTYSLDTGSPPGASVNPATGVFAWVPAETQGPGSYTITLRVTDDGVPPMNDFKTFHVTVGEANTVPTLNPIASLTNNELTAFTFTATATDSDQPANILTYQPAQRPARLGHQRVQWGVQPGRPPKARVRAPTPSRWWWRTTARPPSARPSGDPRGPGGEYSARRSIPLPA